MALVERLSLEKVARLPAPGDNAQIAIRTLPAGTEVETGSEVWRLKESVLEGHRFAMRRILKGERLLSWGLPFGLALRDIQAGEYLCNAKILEEMRERQLGFSVPEGPNFSDYRLPFQLEEGAFRQGEQVRKESELTFEGYRRAGDRGVGTRNFIVVLGTSSRSGGFVQALARGFGGIGKEFPNVDGVAPVAHTEGGGSKLPHNREYVLRALAGFITNPNVGAVLCVDFGNEPINNRELEDFLRGSGYRVEGFPHRFLSIGGGWEAGMRQGEAIIRKWLPEVNRCERSSESAAHLKLALQCGGSDAFSGVSANPLLGILSREVVARGGSANLAETSELIGAESYVLSNVRDLATARKFLATTERFQEWAGWHGHSAEGNPSGGNMLRGLYNITIKSIGAARKKDPAVRLDEVIDYAEPMRDPGFYFMDSPGNDLESIAGQVAAGCNLILFATGNGSITNFPFVPTIKVMTTTGRFDLVRNEMDFNAGRYLDGESLESLGKEALGQLIEIASGRKSRGELAGHSQVQVWREWRQTSPAEVRGPQEYSGEPLKRAEGVPSALLTPDLRKALSKPGAVGRVGLVLPTSLCSGQIALMIAERVNRELKAGRDGLERTIALPHTEGCGNSRGESEEMFMRTLANYLAHPFVGAALLLEHGCEKTHNDAFRKMLRELNIPSERLGWASIQLDGGIEGATRKVVDWFSRAGADAKLPPTQLAVGFWGERVPEQAEQIFESAWNAILSAGGTVVVAEGSREGTPTLGHGARFSEPGLYVMQCPTDDPVEALAGLGACGATVLLTYSDEGVLPGHPLIPVLQIASQGKLAPALEPEKDLFLDASRNLRDQACELLESIARVHQGIAKTRAQAVGNISFQITRGATGISL